MKKIYAFITCLVTFSYSMDAQQFPGGVTSAEVWYQADWDDIDANIYNNDAQTKIPIKNCGDHTIGLFNFNASINTEYLCLRYIAALENTKGRNAFFVGEPASTESSLSHLGTLWNSQLDNEAETDSIIRNFFDVNHKNAFSQDIYTEYSSDKNANINFYHTNHYNIDKKFKSYGQEGETEFYIGKAVNYDDGSNYSNDKFSGNFPEFISFTRELSANERQRVESYLGLKYGITLNSQYDYLNAQNKIFWSSSNNNIFSGRIFGFGRDDISGLNQLQSESTHLKDHLVGAVGKILETNMQKQALTSIPKDHFLVFGDNGGKPALIQDNNNSIKFWEKVWLAQATGQWINDVPIHFKLKLTQEMIDYLNTNEGHVVWMLKDNYVTNDVVSDFTSDFIDYHQGEADIAEGYAYFRGIYFDPNQNIFDQYTFGVGPNLVVQTRIEGCKEEGMTMTVVITGGKPKYNIIIESDEQNYEDLISTSTYTIPVNAWEEYEVTVTDQNGDYVQVLVIPEPWNLEVDLGSDLVLSSNQPSVTLNAGSFPQEVNATYAWYRDGALLPETNNTIVVDEPGIYEVFVTSGDLTCTVSDVVVITQAGIEVGFSAVSGCSEAFNALTIDIESGYAPYTTQIIGASGTTNYTHSGTTTIFDLPYGVYTVSVADAEDNVYQETVEFSAPPDGLGLDLYTQLEDACLDNVPCMNYTWGAYPLFFTSPSNPPFQLDASIGVNGTNMTYEWFQDDQSLGIFTPEITFVPSGATCSGGNFFFTVVITDLTTNCSAWQTFVTRGICPDLNGSNASLQAHTEVHPLSEDTQVEKMTDDASKEAAKTLHTKVYPNPTLVMTPFTYEVSYSEAFEGTVQVLSRTGALIQTVQIEGKNKYRIPLKLDMSGMYLIRTIATNGKTISDQIIIN